MSRQALLSAYEKLAALLGKLPGSLQGPILRELEPIKEIFLRQRPARIGILGDEGIELPSLLNALAGDTVLHAPLARGAWTDIRGAGALAVADLRGEGAAGGQPADIFVFFAAGGARGAYDAARAAAVVSVAPAREGGSPAGLAVVAVGPQDAQDALSALAASGAAPAIVFSLHLPRVGGEFSPEERAALGDRLCDYLPEDAQLEVARFFAARGAQARLAGTALTAFGAVAGVIGMQPIPLADFPILLTLQMFMVALIIYVSGREFSLRLAGEFAASLGVNFGAGLLFRETARAALKVLPVWGHMISGGVAGAGTYAMGRAAIAYFIEDRLPRRLRLWPRRERLHLED